MKRQSGQMQDLGRALSRSSLSTAVERVVVSMNINGSNSGTGDSDRRKVIGEAFLASCQADVILIQESPWTSKNIAKHFGDERGFEMDAHQMKKVYDCYECTNLKDASILVDRNTFNVEWQLTRASDFSSFVPSRNSGISFGSLPHLVSANYVTITANIYFLLERATFLRLRDIETGRVLVVCSYHGPYKVDDATSSACADWIFQLTAWFAQGENYVVGGDFNIDIEQKLPTLPVLPTHHHHPSRPNHYDWIVPSHCTLFNGPVVFVNLFPLPPCNISDGICELPPFDVLDDEGNIIDHFDPWAEKRWMMLQHILKRNRQPAAFLNEVGYEKIFDHSPMRVIILLRR